MKAFKGLKRVELPAVAKALSPRQKVVELLEMVDHPEKYRKSVQAILQIRRTSLFGKVRTEFYDLGNPVMVMTWNTQHEFRAAYSFEEVACKVSCVGCAVRIYVDGRLVKVQTLQEQEFIGGQDFFNFTYTVQPITP